LRKLRCLACLAVSLATRRDTASGTAKQELAKMRQLCLTTPAYTPAPRTSKPAEKWCQDDFSGAAEAVAENQRAARPGKIILTPFF